MTFRSFDLGGDLPVFRDWCRVAATFARDVCARLSVGAVGFRNAGVSPALLQLNLPLQLNLSLNL